MNISLIVAMSQDGVIGKGNKIPWKISEDFKYFKATTMGKPIIMGRKTFESIGRVLPGRTNIIITRKLDYLVKNAIVVNSIGAAFDECKNTPEIMVIGGEEIYKLAMPHANKIYLTTILKDIDGDTRFPTPPGVWYIKDNWVGTESSDEMPYCFSVLEKAL